jgi:hypothetical protein
MPEPGIGVILEKSILKIPAVFFVLLVSKRTRIIRKIPIAVLKITLKTKETSCVRKDSAGPTTKKDQKTYFFTYYFPSSFKKIFVQFLRICP